MSREKQIEEIANDINKHCCSLAEQFCGEVSCNACLTMFLYNAGYRKQSEGEWLHDTKWDTFYCSICDESALNDCYEHQSLSGYCPHCGARMEGGE
jgi:hypothetical protein